MGSMALHDIGDAMGTPRLPYGRTTVNNHSTNGVVEDSPGKKQTRV